MKTCPTCASTLAEDSPLGLCPRCLMRGAISDEAPAGDVSLADVQRSFPELEIIELIGSGGMGHVFKARQPAMDRLVALKVLAPQRVTDPEWIERFTREARALARLNHPHIVQVHSFGAEPQPHLIMEFIDGVNLRQAMQAGGLSAREALVIVPKLCDALHFAHEHGVLHRDIKPENILIDSEGRIKVVDFGLAKLREDSPTAFTLTQSGARIGTLVDHRADIYSLGVVFYEMLTGELPLGRFPSPSEACGSDPRLDGVVMRTLEKKRERRFSDADEMKTEVQRAAEPAPMVPANRSKWWLLVSATCLITALTISSLGNWSGVWLPLASWLRAWTNGLLLVGSALAIGSCISLRRRGGFSGMLSLLAVMLAVMPLIGGLAELASLVVKLCFDSERDRSVYSGILFPLTMALRWPAYVVITFVAWEWWRTGSSWRLGRWLLIGLLGVAMLPVLPFIFAGHWQSKLQSKLAVPKNSAENWVSKPWSGQLVSEASRSDMPHARETAIKSIIQEIESSDPAEISDGLLSIIALQGAPFDKTPLRDAARMHFGALPRLRGLAIRAVFQTNFEEVDVTRVLAMRLLPDVEEFKSLAGALATISNKDFIGQWSEPMLQMLRTSMQGKKDQRRVDERHVLAPLWGAKLSPEIESLLLEWSHLGEENGAQLDTNGIGYNVIYHALSPQMNKSPACVTRLLELLQHHDLVNVAGRCLWGLSQGVAKADESRVADAVIAWLAEGKEHREWTSGLALIRRYATKAQLPALRKLTPPVAEVKGRLDEVIRHVEAKP
jgi:predicted Ser/Thr protein kinase